MVIYLWPLFLLPGGKRALLTFDNRRAETFFLGGGFGCCGGEVLGFYLLGFRFVDDDVRASCDGTWQLVGGGVGISYSLKVSASHPDRMSFMLQLDPQTTKSTPPLRRCGARRHSRHPYRFDTAHRSPDGPRPHRAPDPLRPANPSPSSPTFPAPGLPKTTTTRQETHRPPFLPSRQLAGHPSILLEKHLRDHSISIILLHPRPRIPYSRQAGPVSFHLPWSTKEDSNGVVAPVCPERRVVSSS